MLPTAWNRWKWLWVVCLVGIGTGVFWGRSALGQPALGDFIYVAVPEEVSDVYFFKQIHLPEGGKILRAWTAAAATHEFVLYINGQEACRSRYGRVPSAFRLCEEIEDLGSYFRPGENRLAVQVRRWSTQGPPCPNFFLQAEVQVAHSDGRVEKIPLTTDRTWLGWAKKPEGWPLLRSVPPQAEEVKVVSLPRPPARIPREKQQVIAPDIPPPIPDSLLRAIPYLEEQSVWSQQVVWRDMEADLQRLRELFSCDFVAERYARQIHRANTHMGDTFNITGYPVGNGWVFTTIGPWPFINTTWTLGPEYQYPVQWNPGSTFAGDQVSVSIGGEPVSLEDQWMWKIRKTDVVVSAATDRQRRIYFYAITLAPPKLKALVRIYAVGNPGNKPLSEVVIRNQIPRAKPEGQTLKETVQHEPVADAAGAKNTRTRITGVLESEGVSARWDEGQKMGILEIPLGTVEPGQAVRRLLYHVMYLETADDKPVPSDAPATLDRIRRTGYGLLDETVQYWRNYNAQTTHLEAPGPWGRRVADFIDDVKMLVQVQQFERTGAVGPMWFFSDQWIRDACGPVKSFLRTGCFEQARRVLQYHYIASVAARKILNWVPMDVDVQRSWPAVENWSEITMNYADRHANCEVPSWIILKHYWYWRATGDPKPILQHWEYLKRCYYGQFDNPQDKIFRPDFRFPFHGDETYIYSGGEALWEGRYDLKQNSYPTGYISSADSSFEFVAAGDALTAMGRAIGKTEDAEKIARINAQARQATERYYWMPELGFYAQGESLLQPGQLNRYPMANILANVIWSGYLPGNDPKAISTTLRMAEYLMESSGVLNPIVGYDVSVGMLQGQGLYALSAIDHPWAEKAFYALLMIAGDSTEYSEWMAAGEDFRTMYRANRIRPWEAGINLDALLYFLTGMEPDAPNHRMTLTPRLPSGIYSPIRWDQMTVRHLPLGPGAVDLTVADQQNGSGRRRMYRLQSRSPQDIRVRLRVLIPSAQLQAVQVDGRPVAMSAETVFGQARTVVEITLPAGKQAEVSAVYQPQSGPPVPIEQKTFSPPAPKLPSSDMVIFTSSQKQGDQKPLWMQLADKYKVLVLDAALPTDPETFRAALLDGNRRKTHMLIFDAASMASSVRKATFWEDPQWEKLLGEFFRQGGVVLELNSRNPSSRWLAGLLEGASFRVDYRKAGPVLAADEPDQNLDQQFYWLDEKQAEECGKWSGYWAGNYTMPYLGGSTRITDRALIWGTQEQPHGCMQYTMKTTPGRDHLIRIRTWPRPKKGFTLYVLDPAETSQGKQVWKEVETVWVPIPEDPNANGWIDVYLTLPKQYVTGQETTFRIGPPKGSAGGIGLPGYDSTGAARLWIRDNLQKPPALDQIPHRSRCAALLNLPSSGLVGHSGGIIEFSGFAAPYRILGQSTHAALILKRVGPGLYLKSELAAEFPPELLLPCIDTLLDPNRRETLRQQLSY